MFLVATPHIAGVAALVWSHFESLTASQIRNVLERTATDLGAPGRDDEFGHGLVNAKAAYDFLSGNSSFSPTFTPTTSSPTETPTAINCGNGQKLFELNIVPDNYPSETSWTLVNICTKVPVLEGTYQGIKTCVDHQSYLLTMYDSWGDGILDPGSFLVIYDNDFVYQGGNFTDKDSISLGDDVACTSLAPSLSPTLSPSITNIPTTVPSLSLTLQPSLFPTFETVNLLRSYSLGFAHFSDLDTTSQSLFQNRTSDYLMSSIDQAKQSDEFKIETITCDISSRNIVDGVHDGIKTYSGAYSESYQGKGLVIEMNIHIQLKLYELYDTDILLKIIDNIFRDSFSDYKAYLLQDNNLRPLVLVNSFYQDEFLPLYVVIGFVGVLMITFFIGVEKRRQKRKKTIAVISNSMNEKKTDDVDYNGQRSLRSFLNLEDSRDEYLDSYIKSSDDSWGEEEEEADI